MKKLLITLSFGAVLCFVACSESSSTEAVEDDLSSFVDSRDKHSYKKVTIGDQTWMAENLSYKRDFYSWEDALDACPEGWRLPSDEDWKALFDEVGGVESAALKLKASTGWKSNGNGNDNYGFAVHATGFRNDSDKLLKKGERALFWSSTELDDQHAYNWRFDDVSDYVFHEDYAKDFELSVRCVEGETDEELPSSSDGSSSSGKASSSSSQKKSSSSYAMKPTVYDDAKHTLTDGRDGQVYKTVTINNYVWMAENLNFNYYYKTARSFCYENDTANCSKYGRLYNEGAAYDSLKVFSENSWKCAMDHQCGSVEFVRGVCPEGWHVPAIWEWNELFYYVDANNAVKKLKATQGWNGREGTDDYGFSILAVGFRSSEGGYYKEGAHAGFWSSTKKASYVYLNENEVFSMGVGSGARSIRCVKDFTKRSENPKPDHEFVYGTVKDSRDGNVYKTIEIENQVWMAENLKLDIGDTTLSSCFNGNPDNCKNFGRMYSWSAAVDSAGVYSEDALGCGYRLLCSQNHTVKGICPDGWRMPDVYDWMTLEKNTGGPFASAQNLKATQGWPKNGNGYDLFGFNALPYPDSDFVDFWSASDEGFANIGKGSYFAFYSMQLLKAIPYKDDHVAVRCIKSTAADSNYTSLYIKDESAYDAAAKTLTDYRDNKVYRTVKIGEQVWMAENLNFKYVWGKAQSSCKDYDIDGCETYGRLYGWSATVDSVGIFSDDGKGCGMHECEMAEKARGVCPRGWHLPSASEWEVLIDAAGGADVAGFNLKAARGKGGWFGELGNDSLGFSVMAAGCAGTEAIFSCGISDEAHFYTSTWEDDGAVTVSFSRYDKKVNMSKYKFYTPFQYSIRCIKDEE
jgi:uncharacterized protein (TIGR02145 family)